MKFIVTVFALAAGMMVAGPALAFPALGEKAQSLLEAAGQETRRGSRLIDGASGSDDDEGTICRLLEEAADHFDLAVVKIGEIRQAIIDDSRLSDADRAEQLSWQTETFRTAYANAQQAGNSWAETCQ